MRVLMTGASSFTGAWIAKALIEEGAELWAALARERAAGGFLRASRLSLFERRSKVIDLCPLGSERWFEMLDWAPPFDLVIFHGAMVGNFRDRDFDWRAAVGANTAQAGPTLDRLVASGCRRLVVTGSVFEADEGQGDYPLDAIGDYGLAKTLSWQILRHEARRRDMALGKLIIPHPFGAFERPGLISHLMTNWLGGAPARLDHPELRRDFIHVELLAISYARFALALPSVSGLFRRAPSGYRETVSEFAARLSQAMQPRLGLTCGIEHSQPVRLSGEPVTRQNTDTATELDGLWSAEKAWNSLADFYVRDQTKIGYSLSKSSING